MQKDICVLSISSQFDLTIFYAEGRYVLIAGKPKRDSTLEKH